MIQVFKDIKATIPQGKDTYHIWLRFVLRPVSIVIAWVFLKTKISANTISYTSALICVLSAFLVVTGNTFYMILGCIGFNLFSLLDCVDGNMARYRNKANPYGEWADALGGYFASALVLPSVGIAVGLNAETGLMRILFTGLGVWAGLTNILCRIIQKKYQEIKAQESKDDGMDKKSIIRIIDSNMGITGFLMPSVLVGVLTGYLKVVLIFFSAYYIVGSLSYIVSLILRVEREKEHI